MLNNVVILLVLAAQMQVFAYYYQKSTLLSQTPRENCKGKNTDSRFDFTGVRITHAYLHYTAPGTHPRCQRKYVFEICYAPTSHDMKDFLFFRKRWIPSEYRAYILCSPSYGSRDASTHMTHRVPDEIHRDKYYVSWITAVKSFDDMVLISKHWADLTQRYLETGKKMSIG